MKLLQFTAAAALGVLPTTHAAIPVAVAPPSPPCCFAAPTPDGKQPPPPPTADADVIGRLRSGDLSRRDALLLGAGGIGYGKLVGDALVRLGREGTYPEEHERRVRSTFSTALVEAARAAERRGRAGVDVVGSSGSGEDRDATTGRRRPLRVLEVGVGSDCRNARRGLYGSALDELLLLASGGGAEKDPPSGRLSGVDIVGVDLSAPAAKVVAEARDALSRPEGCILPSFRVTFDARAGDVTSRLPFPDGAFDAVVCSLTLCSVTDQDGALAEIRRLLRPDGGTFGFVEHVAVRLDEEGESDRAWLEWQQRTLDPLQQLVADNCHLHRNTDKAIWNALDAAGGSSSVLDQERFFVDSMWPVSCQCRGVIQRIA